MSSNDRYEHVCSQCGKSRFLSDAEATEDGWTIQFNAGLTCPRCKPSYGPPLTLPDIGTRERNIYASIGKHPDVPVSLVVEAVNQGYIP